MLAQLLRGQVTLQTSECFLQTLKLVIIRLCNNLLVTLQVRPPRPEDRFFGLYAELSQANKSVAISLASLSDHETCSFLNEMLLVRVKAELTYQELALKLPSAAERHQLRKTVAEI